MLATVLGHFGIRFWNFLKYKLQNLLFFLKNMRLSNSLKVLGDMTIKFSHPARWSGAHTLAKNLSKEVGESSDIFKKICKDCINVPIRN